MTCIHCGMNVPAEAVRCPACHRPIEPVTSVTLGPHGSSDADEATIAPGFAGAPPHALSAADGDALTVGFGVTPAPPESPRSRAGAGASTLPPVFEAPTIAPGFDAATMPPWSGGAEAATMPPGLDGATRPPWNATDDAVTGAPGVARAVAAGGGHDAGPLHVGQSFGPRYHIIRMLGVGGMGAVYQAWDAELGVAVAIKVIRPEVMRDRHAAEEIERRFKRELLLARQVTHKNVVRIHDIGNIEGIRYITMTYVEGSDLATLLKRSEKLTLPEVLRIFRGVLSGVAAAHTAGVVHRDLKPANVMIDADGEAIIMDFGIALSTGDKPKRPSDADFERQRLKHQSADYTAATTVGSIVGTLEYMAPEQAMGEAVDQRADVYALGLILYDAIAGKRRARHSESAFAELERRKLAPPPALKTIRPDIPDALDQLIARCVDPDPAKRFQTSAEMAAALDRLDDNGVPLPVKRTMSLPMVAAIVTLLLALSGGAYYYQSRLIPATAHDPVSVLIADLDNTTGDPAFSRTLEPMLKLALEEAGFISAIDRTQIRARLGVAPPAQLDEKAANELAVKQGVGVVLSGSIVPQGQGYTLAIKASETVTGKAIASLRERAAGREQVLAAATKLATSVREALGDDTSDSTRRFATDTLSATSLDVVRNYATAMEAQADGRFEDALTAFQQSLKADQNFGLAYAGLASSSRNLGRAKDAEQYAMEAVRHVDRMTERERYRARGLVYMATGDYQQCLKEFGDMLTRYAADVIAYNNLAFCQTQLRDMPSAVKAVRRATQILPKRALYRLNLALYAAYGGDFETAVAEAKNTQDLGNPLGLQPLAYAQVAQGQLVDALATYRALGAVGSQGASIAASGVADLAVYEGRFAEAARLYEQGAAIDLMQNNPDRAAAKLTALAHVQLLRGRKDLASAAATKAIATSQSVRTRLLAARLLIDAGQPAKAAVVAMQLASELPVEAQASAKILEGDLALADGKLPQAIKALGDANDLLDTWIGQFDLGRAFFAAKRMTQADSAFDRCITRSGELFLDEEPSYGYLPAAYYYQGRVREDQKSVAFADSYKKYLSLREKAGEDPLLKEVKRRAGS